MTRPVRVIHPAHVAHRPRRARSERDTLVRHVTDVVLRETDGAGFEHPFALHGREEMRGYEVDPWVRDGVAWRPLRQLAQRGEGLATVGGDELAAWLSGEVPEHTPLWKGLARAFEATPLQLRLPPLAQGVEGGFSDATLRGTEPGDLGAVLSDEREAASAAVARFLDEEVLVAGGMALMRLRPLVATYPDRRDDRLRVQLGREVNFRHPPFSPARAVEAVAFARGGVVAPVSSVLADTLLGLPGNADDGHDLRVMANAMPEAILRVLDVLARGKVTQAASRTEACRALAERLRPLARRGARGLIDDTDLPAACATMAEATATVGDLFRWCGSNSEQTAFDTSARYLHEVALPRLHAPVTGVDADALGALAP